MANKRIQGRRPKGFHLSTDECEMLNQLLIVIGHTESSHVGTAIREYFMKVKRQYLETFGATYWQSCLDSMGHTDQLEDRRVQRLSR